MVEVDLSEIPSEIVRKALHDTIEKQLKSKKYKLNVTSASQAGENNFIGIIYRVEFSGDEECENEKRHLILKVAPNNVLRRNQFLVRPAFVREIYTYDTVLPMLLEFERSRGVEDGFTEYPRCYRTVDVDLNECLILEDLSLRGFTVIDRRREEVTADHIRLVMKTLGKLHAVSFAMNDQQPEKFNEIVSNLSEVFIRREDDHLRKFFNGQSEHVFNSVSGEEDTELLAKAKKVYERDVIDVAADCLELVGPATVISHGDAWQNNTMFKYDNYGKPCENTLIDWQTSRNTSPIIDIVYYMFCCTTKKLRDAHYDELLKVYHDSLSEHILKLGSDPEQLFPFKLMLEHFRKFAKFGLILSTVLLPMMTSDAGNGIDLDGIAEDVQNGKEVDKDAFISENSRKKFNERLRGVVIDMARLGYI